MNYNTILTDSRWEIIKAISEEDLSATELAKHTKTSIANVSQQLRLLEAYGLIKKISKINNGIGKPKTRYTISKEVIETLIVSKNHCEKKSLDLDYLQKAILNLWLHTKKENHYFLEKFLTTYEEVTVKCQAIYIIKITIESIELLLVTEKLDEIRQKYSSQKISNLEGQIKTIICWTHSTKEIEEGLKRKENHFIQLVTNLKPFLDKEEITKKIKQAENGTSK
ncbi:MAG: helix-turn-helix domain-containing protein [Nanoarchaeota archaeon]|nr:helix-turn-helix domain-containing protein [Nanoarchaeota archaeon]MBU1269728.1 helix-turn-helix domain-containing protein [Nanoarchaeota archaeon]MBU1604029.1 helix-turn-helix domain-containing protein [Nanoarchaeota archaeon]